MRLVLLGPPGAGKGTQAVGLAARLGIPAISTGDIFRSNIKGGTELGKLAQSYTSTGRLVPDEVTNDMVADRLAQDDVAPGFLLDGYPRNAAQVDALDAMLAASGTPLDAVVLITADTDAWRSGCSSGLRSRAVRTIPRTSSGTARRSTPPRPRH